MNVRVVSFICMSFFITSLLVAPVRAGPVQDVQYVVDSLVQVVGPLLQKILGGAELSSELFFAKILFLVIILSLVWVSINQIELFRTHVWVHWLLAVAVALLATRWIGDASIIQTVLLPYSALGIALTAGLPFLLFFFLVNVGMQHQSRLIRRIAWIFFAVIFIFLWFSRYDELQNTGAAYIYPLTVLVSLLMILFDGTVSRFLLQTRLEKIGKTSAQDAITEYSRKIADLPNLVTQGVLTQPEADRRKKEYAKKIAYFHRY